MIPDRSALDARIERLLRQASAAVLRAEQIGLEKEALRVTPEGTIAQTPHPPALGAALTHPYLTTDFSEALLECISPPLPSPGEVLRFLEELHQFSYLHLGEELLWCASMPCRLPPHLPIPLAQYGTSNLARMKTVYRRGLANRYGRTMQAIAGLHYNFSYGEPFWEAYQAVLEDRGDRQSFRSESYLGLVRNLQRYGWLIPYLFGASPAVDRSFARSPTDLQAWDRDSLCYPFATSLRLGDIGYQNRQTEGTGMKACYDSLDAYVRSLTWAIETPCPHYERIGIKVGDRYEQLNANVLQIENEYYSTVRPKQPPRDTLEKPTIALRRRGVGYIELRSLDLNPFEPLGIDSDQLAFLAVFTRFCLLAESPIIRPRERRAIDENQVRTAHQGRMPNLRLDTGEQAVPLRDWALHLIDAMKPIGELLDGSSEGIHQQSLAAQRERVLEPDRTPSARILAEMRANGESFVAFAHRLSEDHRARFQSQPLAPERLAFFQHLAEDSHRKQQAIEGSDRLPFDAFLAAYFAQGLD